MKEYNNITMYCLESIPTNKANCKYIPYSIINQTSIMFVTECAVPQFNLQESIVNITLTLEEGQKPDISY
jgi:hypothetical protein